MLLLATLAHAQVPPPIVGGELDLEHPAVGMLASFDDLGGYIFCSGTVIEPEWVLTSASCAEEVQLRQEQGLRIELMLGFNLTQLDEQIAVAQAYPYPEWDHVGTEVGLLKLASPAQVQPARWNRLSLGPEIEDSTVTYVGYGVSQSSASDAGYRRTASVPVLRLTANAIWGYHEDTAAPKGFCIGDFGGPALLEVDGELLVAGVIAEVLQDGESKDPCKGYGISVRTDIHAGWIQELTLGLIDTGTVDSGPVEVSFSPETEDCSGCGGGGAGAAAFWGVGLLLLSRRRRASESAGK